MNPANTTVNPADASHTSQPLRVLVVMDPIQSINPKKDSTLAMLWAASRRGHELWYAEQDDLWLDQGRARGQVRPLTVFENLDHWFELGEMTSQPLGSFDLILMRKDPPFDMRFVYSTYMLEQAERDGAWVINKPQSLRDCNEKLFATQFPELMVPTRVTANGAIIREFLAQYDDIIVKPLDGMGGTGIFRLTVGSPNVGSTLEMLTQGYQQPIMAQRYIPAIIDGDKRILMINGEPVDYCLARIPQHGETRGNLAAGGRGEARPLTARDRELAAKIGPTLRDKGLIFVGLDVIGDYVTEINVTSPTCIREIDAAYGISIADQLFDVLEKGSKPA